MIMPPKLPRRASTSTKDALAASKAVQNASMPPPPDPLPPLGIMEAEANTLSLSLRNATVKIGQVYEFYADARKLGIQKYAPSPPRSLTASLGREIEKYDQLCDAMEAHLHRAIAVLQRDIKREEQRLKADAEAAAKAAAPVLPEASFTTTPPASPTLSTLYTGASAEASTSKPALPLPARRQSTVSLSSLQRPPFPHKLDLSSAALRMNPEEGLMSGLSSPVTLAPKSSHKSMSQDMLLGLDDGTDGPIHIDLTQVGDLEMNLQRAAASSVAGMDSSLGNSADKPIELDLDMDVDLFHEGANNSANTQGEHLFHEASAPAMDDIHGQSLSLDVKPKIEDDIFMNALQAVDSTGGSDDIFATLEGPSLPDASIDDHGAPGSHHAVSENAANGASSSASILASLNTSSSHSVNQPAQDHDGRFDLQGIDLSNFPTLSADLFRDDSAEHGLNESDMANLFSIGTETGDAEKGTSAA
ncbi:uncharacterized protein LAESUDRAFT_184145 [Laetiporus sulphureus 93-53]|uniref:Uncharacterized protein n=1 Tax=Laetiporus sulphureus 93-53 TaxID=1314785 RepID=A0A165E412_9APHY|nr:uncharacterized protein LAESUDRAFT_184145 [Laetiporus sulphureus 93-53]KZT06208.1 hypothetical protein LAESUDRAFT_184145 [Laetiporus sulphureus 93-53]